MSTDDLLAELRALLASDDAWNDLRHAPRAEEIYSALTGQPEAEALMDQLAALIEGYAAQAAARLAERARRGDMEAMDVVAQVVHTGDPEVLHAYFERAHHMSAAATPDHTANFAAVLCGHYNLDTSQTDRAYWEHVLARVAFGQEWALQALLDQGRLSAKEWLGEPDLLARAFNAVATWQSQQSAPPQPRR